MRIKISVLPISIYLAFLFAIPFPETVLTLQVFGRHVPSNRVVSGAYKNEFGENQEIDATINAVKVPCPDENK